MDNMKITFLLVIFIGVTTVSVRSEDTKYVPPQPPPTTTSPQPSPNTTTTTSTTHQPSPNTTTTTSTTPQPSPNTTTTTSTTPQPSPNTTTTTSTTPQPSPNTTTTTSTTPQPSPNTTTSTPQPTLAPNTTSTSTPPSSTPIPPEPKTGKWFVKDKNVTCIVADMAIQLNITFGIDKSKQVILDVPENASSSGSCDNNTQLLLISWQQSNVTSKIAILFEKNDTTKMFSMAEVNVTLPQGVVPDFNASLNFFENQVNFSTPLSKSYKCMKVQQLHLTHLDNNTDAVLKISNVQFEAFRDKQDENFGSAEDCESSNSSTDVVPIAVGCVLVGLVVVVLVAYLVGRRRSQSRGYLSM